ncbi:MAG: IclR family transcriptional regulator [Gammaproteobacteria bacterium]
MRSKAQKYSAPALEKGLDILELLARASTPMTMGEISQGVGRSRNEIFRMLQVLEKRGYLVKSPGDSGYSLSNRLFMLGTQQPRISNVTELAIPVMRRLADQIGQPCHLVTASEEEIVVIAQVDAPSDVGLVVRAGHRRPLAHSTSGLVLFAFQSDAVRSRWLQMLDAGSVAYDRTTFLKFAEQVRRRGYARRASEAVDGVVDLCAPVMQHGHAEYTLTVPFIRRHPELIKEAGVIELLCAAAAEVSNALKYGPPRASAGALG